MSEGLPPLYKKQYPSGVRAYDAAAGIVSTAPTSLVNASPYMSNQTQTTYMGMPAYRIDISTGGLTIPANGELPQAMDFTENGVVIGFEIAVNSPLFKITCILYGDQGSTTTLVDDTMQDITDLGRGLTRGQAESIAPQGYSLDQAGTKSDIWPWIQRYRHTVSYNAIQNGLQQDDVAGTADDLWIVLAYTPSIKEGYTRFYLNILNESGQTGIIHKLQVSRIKFQAMQNPIYRSASTNLAQEVKFPSTLGI